MEDGEEGARHFEVAPLDAEAPAGAAAAPLLLTLPEEGSSLHNVLEPGDRVLINGMTGEHVVCNGLVATLTKTVEGGEDRLEMISDFACRPFPTVSGPTRSSRTDFQK